MPIKLDLKDKKLLYELDIDSRQPASQLAKKIGISKQGCTLKINNLVKKGVIVSFPTVISTALIGHLSFRMYFKLIDITPKQEEEFRNYLIAHKAVPWVVGCQGMWDYIIVVFPTDFENFEKFNTELNNKYGAYIEKKDIALVTAAHHFRSGYILGKKIDLPPLIYAGQPKEVIELDTIEKMILTLLSKDARIPVIDIARKIKIPAKTVTYRIEKLRKLNIIEGYIMTVDLDKIDFERYKVFIRTKNMSQEKEKLFIEWSRMHSYILYYSRSIGENDVELELIVKDNIHLREVIIDVRNKFGELIKSYEALKIYKEFKLNYYPWGELVKYISNGTS
ncbi:MAG: Lrp/AsnC family transcriptional regulator [Nanoarchaeota archaeon]|nr:Lrp/AsnC family transcriptional regulator [Nanoarchaeota archaeon]MBU1604397.1 Lrp/AsnC family transcriptional regulator [Nanoarchaeota archaeon]MBU2443258.1 Lrp/AsnC family transcriptional regulator [Nanoarchaeota archaeon]